MSHAKRLSLYLVPLVLFALFPLLLSAQDNMGNNMGNRMSATGCLMKGASADGYYLKGADGKTYELWGYKGLSEHVNHKVAVTGTEQKMPDTMEKEKSSTEMSEAGGQPQMDLKVTHLKVISENCQ